MEKNDDRKSLEQKLGNLTYKIGKKSEEMRKLNTELQAMQVESNGVATQIEKLDG